MDHSRNFLMTPRKYTFLVEAKSLGLQVPETLFLDFETLRNNEYKTLLNNFIDQNKALQYIVRSCVSAEDGSGESMAGHFFSSPPVAPEQLTGMVSESFVKNTEIQTNIAPTAKVNLMVQPFISAEIGGVIFSPWKYFTYHFVGEVTAGGAEAAVTGKDSQFFGLSKTGDFTDFLPQENLPSAELKKMVQTLENHFKCPLDIEWCAKKGVVTLLQARPMTRSLQALNTATTAETKTELAFLNKVAVGEWQMGAYAESLGELSPLSFSVLQKCYEESVETFQTLGFKAETFNFLARSRNGQVYENPTTQADFFKLKAWFSPFTQTASEPRFKQKIEKF